MSAKYAAVVVRRVGPVVYPVAAFTGDEPAALLARAESWSRRANRANNYSTHSISIVQHEPPPPLVVNAERATLPLFPKAR